MALLADIAKEFGRIPELFRARKKAAESARVASEVEAKLNVLKKSREPSPFYREPVTAESTLAIPPLEKPPAIKLPLVTGKAPAPTYPLNVALSLASETVDTMARFVIQTTKNLNSLSPSPVTDKILASVNPEAIGIDGKLETSGEKLWNRYDELNRTSPPIKTIDTWRNALTAVKDVIIPQVFDMFVTEGIVNVAAHSALKATYPREYRIALKTLDLGEDFSRAELKNKFTGALGIAIKRGDREAVKDILSSGMVINAQLTEKGQVILNPLGKAIQRIGETFTSPITELGKITFPLSTVFPAGELPGYRPVRPGVRPAGLSTEEIERVGGKPIKPDKHKSAEGISPSRGVPAIPPEKERRLGELELRISEVRDRLTLLPPSRQAILEQDIRDMSEFLEMIKAGRAVQTAEQIAGIERRIERNKIELEALQTGKPAPSLDIAKEIEARDLFDRLAEVFEKEFLPLVREVVPEVKPIFKELEPLAQEARKYKTAEEFVKAQKQVFRGGRKLDPSKLTKEGISVSINELIARSFVPEFYDFSIGADRIVGILEDFYISPSAKIIKPNEIPEKLFKRLSEKGKAGEQAVVDWARKKGVDAVDFGEGVGIPEIRVLNPDILKTKSQLTDIWNKAVKGIEPEVKPIFKELEPLAQEARVNEVKRVADNLQKHNPELGRVDAEAMAKDVIGGRRFTLKAAPKELEPLTVEARKYKTAEEFVRAQKQAFHGAPIELKEIGFGEGVRSQTFLGTTKKVRSGAIFFSPNKDVAEFFGKNRAEWLSDLGQKTKPAVYERFLNIKNPADFTTIESAQKVIDKAKIDLPKTFNLSTFDEEISLETYIKELGQLDLDQMWKGFDKSEFVNALKKVGYDGAILKETGDRGISYAIFDPKQAFTKSQLTDIWNKAVKGIEPEVKPIFKELEPLAQEARKYKTAEEFVNSKLIGEKVSFESPTMKNVFNEGIYIKDNGNGTSQIKVKTQGFADWERTVKNEKISSDVKSQLTDIWNKAVKGVEPEVKPTIPKVPESLQPFTKQEQDAFNAFTHYPVDFNKEYADLVTRIRNIAKQKLGELPAELNSLFSEYEKRTIQYLRDRGEMMIKAPPPSVVGPAKYNVARTQKAHKVFEKKSQEFLDFERRVESQINALAREKESIKFGALSESEKLQYQIQKLEKSKSNLNLQRDAFFIERIDRQIANLKKKLDKQVKGIKPEVEPSEFEQELSELGYSEKEILELDELVAESEVKPPLGETLRNELIVLEQTIKEHPAQALTKYADKTNQELPEVLGLTGGKFQRFGDDIAGELGFETSEEARESYQNLVKLRERRTELLERIKEAEKPAVLPLAEKEIIAEEVFGGLEPAEIVEVKSIAKEIKPAIGAEVEKIRTDEEIRFTKIVKDKLAKDILALGGIRDKVIPSLFKDEGLTWENMVKELREVGGYNITEKEIKDLFSKTAPKRTVKQLETINPELLASDAQKAKLRIAATEKGLSDGQVKRLAKIYFDKNITELTKVEAGKFMDIIESVAPGFGGPRIPRTRALLPPEAIPEISGEKPIREVGIGSRFLSPRQVFKNIGDAPYKNIFEPMETGAKIYGSNLAKIFNEIAENKKKLGMGRLRQRLLPKTYGAKSEKLFNYLNNEVKPILTPKEQEVADWAKSLFDKYADRLDESLARQGLPPVNRRKNYITNLINADIKEALRGGRINSEMFAILQDVVPKAVYDPFLLARKGKLPIQKDFWKAISVYARVTEKKLAFDVILPRVQAYLKFLPSEDRNYANWFIKHTMGRPSEMDRLFRNTLQSFFDKVAGFRKLQIPIETVDGIVNVGMEIPRVIIPTKILTKTIAKLRSWNYFSFIGANLRTMLVNLTQPVRGVAEFPGFHPLSDLKAIAYGGANVLVRIFSKRQWRLMREKGILTEAEQMLTNEFSTTGLLADLTMWNMKISEFFNRVGTTYAGAKSFRDLLKGRGIELTMQEAEVLGKELSDFINFRYGITEVPKAFANPLGQLYYQYNSFALKLLEGLADDARRTFKPGQVEAFVEAVKGGKGAEYLREQGPPTRLALIKYILYTGIIITALSGMGIGLADIFYKGAIPSQVENAVKGLAKLVKGEWYEAMAFFGRAAVPATISGLAPTKLLDVYVPSGIVPAERQLRRLKEAETTKQLLGFEPLPKEELSLWEKYKQGKKQGETKMSAWEKYKQNR